MAYERALPPPPMDAARTVTDKAIIRMLHTDASYQEIADALSIPKGTVSRRIQHMRDWARKA